MLIDESGDMQAVCLRAPGDARPIHVHRDVRVTDLLERRIQMPMLRADLNAFVKFIARKSVIDRRRCSRVQVCRNGVDPIECSLIKGRLSSRRLGKLPMRFAGRLARRSRTKTNSSPSRSTSFSPLWPDQTTGIASSNSLEKWTPTNGSIDRSRHSTFSRNDWRRLRLPILQDWKRLDDSVSQSRKKVRPAFARRLQHVTRKFTMVGALLDNDEVFWLRRAAPRFPQIAPSAVAQKADRHSHS